MLTKNNIKKLRQVGVSVWSRQKNIRFANGKHSARFIVYDATPDEVLKVIEKALEQQR
jgi:predicted exporter